MYPKYKNFFSLILFSSYLLSNIQTQVKVVFVPEKY